jgi:hypothetical protein
VIEQTTEVWAGEAHEKMRWKRGKETMGAAWREMKRSYLNPPNDIVKKKITRRNMKKKRRKWRKAADKDRS